MSTCNPFAEKNGLLYFPLILPDFSGRKSATSWIWKLMEALQGFLFHSSGEEFKHILWAWHLLWSTKTIWINMCPIHLQIFRRNLVVTGPGVQKKSFETCIHVNLKQRSKVIHQLWSLCISMFFIHEISVPNMIHQALIILKKTDLSILIKFDLFIGSSKVNLESSLTLNKSWRPWVLNALYQVSSFPEKKIFYRVFIKWPTDHS